MRDRLCKHVRHVAGIQSTSRPHFRAPPSDDYGGCVLDDGQLDRSAIAQLVLWLEDAVAAGERWATAMTLATVSEDGRPSARAVLLKQLDDDGLVFFTNYGSRKARELAASPYAAVTFLWPGLNRQARVEGGVQRLTPEESDDYFRTRSLGSQISAWSSPQSRPIESRKWLETRYAAAAARFVGRDVPRPVYWGGFRIAPDIVELWQGRPNRLHERVRYSRADGEWRLERLAP